MADKIRIGVFGSWRGSNYVDLMRQEKDEIEVIAICDKAADKIRKDDGETAAIFSDFDEFLEYGKTHGMNAMFLSNFFNQHAPFAIKAMEAGMDVVSECTSAGTMKECVDLVRAVEATGRKYMIAENYPFMTANLEMDRLVKAGSLGTLLYAEGEYNHSGDLAMLKELTPTKYHWRAWMPRTYYVTHAMGPLMYMTGTMPKYVSGRAVHSDLMAEIRSFRHNCDGVGMMFCEMDNGMIARFTGCTAMASDYTRYRICGDRGSVESMGPYGDQVRLMYESHTRPADVKENVTMVTPDLAKLGERGEKAAKAGHGGGDYWVVRNMVDYFLHDVTPFFDVYKGVAMSATAILGWRSALSHGENIEVPDFSREYDRIKWEKDDLTPFPDENGNGITLPCAL